MNRPCFLLIISFLLFITGCWPVSSSQSPENTPYSRTEILMGTPVSVRIYDEGKEALLDDVFARIEELADMIDVNIKDSEIYTINENAGVRPVTVSAETFYLIDEGIKHSEESGGTFDITIGPLTSLWNIGFDDARRPEDKEIEAVLPLIDYKNVELNEEEQSVYLKEEGMRLDLGGIAKGYFADLAADLLIDKGVEAAIVDLGGNIYVIGSNPSGEDWSIGIQDPHAERRQTLGQISASDQSIVTSGIYERILPDEEQDYHHLLDPEDGFPFMNELAGVSVVSETSIDGDALSTAAFAKGLEAGLAYIENIPETEAVFVTRDNNVFLTDGLEEGFELTNDDFTVVN